MKLIEVPIEALHERLTYEPDTGHLRWRYHVAGGVTPGQIAGCLKQDGYLEIAFNGQKLRAHRVCWALHHGFWPKVFIDHKNGKTTDNRIENLREADRFQNGRNRHARLSPTGFKGVTKVKNRYQAQMSINGRQKFLGSFATAEEAARRHDFSALEHHGEFANLNFPAPASPSTGEPQP